MKPSSSHPAYRADIDGLRAVAVLSVVGFHAFPGWVKGGFVGVDVFFVISGYLISTIIIGNLERGTFSLAEFYSRRVKRIFPALALLLAACAVLGWLVLLPNEYSRLGKHIAGGAGFVSNLVLLGEAGYFDSSAATKPLLHLWSLGIEEQFYFVWPVLLYLARKRRIGVLLLVVGVGSFALNLALLSSNRVAAFYSPLTRFWELLIGSALAYLTLHRPRWVPASARASNIASLAGGALIVVAVNALDSDSPFPGWRALLPTVGAFLLIAAGPAAWLNRLVVSRRLLVWVGLISYPLYLWHWPLLTFAYVYEGATPSPKIRIAAIVIAFVLSWATYKLVEKPIRLGKTGKSTVGVLLASVAALLVVGLVVVRMEGFAAARGPWNVVNISDSYSKSDQFTEECRKAEVKLFSPAFDPKLDFCHSTIAGNPKIEIVVIGDSHAGRIYSGLQGNTESSMLNLGRGSCLPLIGYEANNPGKDVTLGCSPTMGRLIDRALELSPRTVVLSGYFVLPYEGRVVPRGTGPVKALMRETLARVSAAVPKVVVVLDVPELPFEPSYCVNRPIKRGVERGNCAFSRSEPDRQLALYEADLRAAASDLPNVSFFNPADVLCDHEQCFAVRDAHLLYDDRNHLSRYAASLVGKALESHLK